MLGEDFRVSDCCGADWLDHWLPEGVKYECMKCHCECALVQPEDYEEGEDARD